LQHIATHCNSLQRTATHCNALQLTATPCKSLQQYTATHSQTGRWKGLLKCTIAAHCSTLQHSGQKCKTARHCKTLQDTARHCKTLQLILRASSWKGLLKCHTAGLCKTLHDSARYSLDRVAARAFLNAPLQHTAPLCNTLQHSAPHCRTLQDTARHCNTLQLVHIPGGWKDLLKYILFRRKYLLCVDVFVCA